MAARAVGRCRGVVADAETLMLLQVAWSDAAESAFMAVYGDEGEVSMHRAAVAEGSELLMDGGPHGFLTLRIESDGVAVVTGLAGNKGGFDPMRLALEAYFPCVAVETYREPIVKKLQACGYAVDYVRLYKNVEKQL